MYRMELNSTTYTGFSNYKREITDSFASASMNQSIDGFFNSDHIGAVKRRNFVATFQEYKCWHYGDGESVDYIWNVFDININL